MRYLIIILITILLNACQFNQSTKKDLLTGASSRGNGLGSDDVQIEINGKTENRNTYVFGEKVNFIFNDIKGLKEIDGKTYPGMSIYIVKDKDTLLSEDDLIDPLEDGTNLSPLLLKTHFIAALPITDNYKVYINIWDKKGDGTFKFEMPFEVEENKIIDITASNLEYSTIYLWNESKQAPVLDKNIDINDNYILISEKVKGLKNIDGKVYPIFSIDIEDSKGNKILSDPNVLNQYETGGLNAEAFSAGQIPINISFTKGKIFNPCILTATLTDKNSTNSIHIKSELVIE